MIQKEGLVPYVAMEMGKKPFPSYVRRDVPTHSSKNCCPMMPCQACMARAKTRVPLKPAAGATSSPSASTSGSYGSSSRYLADSHAPVTQPRSNISLPVRPTAAPRVIGSVPQAGMATPPVASSAPVGHPLTPPPAAPAVQQHIPPTPAKLPLAVAPSQKPVARQEVPAPVAKENKVAPLASAPSRVPPQVAPKTVSPMKSAPAPSVPSAPQQPAEVTGEVPFGSPIAGRPGMVHSPFASKYQLVDVTGLPPGTEVKCPYTGKLFRVPPGVEASNRLPSRPGTEAP